MVYIKRFSVLILIVLFLCGCGKMSDGEKFKREYEDLNGKYRSVNIDKDNSIIYSSPKDIIKKINNGNSLYIYFGNAKSDACRKVVSGLVRAGKDRNVEIYYIDTLKYKSDLSVFNDISGLKVNSPNVVAISGGRVIDQENGSGNSSSKFKCLFKCLEKNSNICKKNSC